MALCGVIFASGDASQRLDDHGKRLDRVELEVGDLKVNQAAMAAQLNDIQVTVHDLAGTPVPAINPYGNAAPASRRRPG